MAVYTMSVDFAALRKLLRVVFSACNTKYFVVCFRVVNHSLWRGAQSKRIALFHGHVFNVCSALMSLFLMQNDSMRDPEALHLPPSFFMKSIITLAPKFTVSREHQQA